MPYENLALEKAAGSVCLEIKVQRARARGMHQQASGGRQSQTPTIFNTTHVELLATCVTTAKIIQEQTGHCQTQVCDDTPTEQNRSTQSNLVILFNLPQSSRKALSVNGLLSRFKVHVPVCVYGYVCSQVLCITSIHES